MKKLVRILTALASLTIASAAQAQLGLTLEECQAKYGEGICIKGIWCFDVGSLELNVETIADGGIISRIEYHKMGSVQKLPRLSNETIKRLLKQNAPSGLIWSVVNSNGPRYGAFTPEELKTMQEPGCDLDFPGEVIAWLDPRDNYTSLTIAKNGYQGDE
jgi:hypothetical protein